MQRFKPRIGPPAVPARSSDEMKQSVAMMDPEADIAGVFTLSTLDGKPLPFRDAGGSYEYTWLADVITMIADGLWTESFTYQQTINGLTTPVTETQAGTWTAVGDLLTMVAHGRPFYTGTYDTNTLRLNGSGYVLVFKRQR